ncbi:hypothetical protein N9Y45_00215 [Erythrobacter sp.]|nr:hypothetical protein [Erythrobacter sp.]
MGDTPATICCTATTAGGVEGASSPAHRRQDAFLAVNSKRIDFALMDESVLK